MDDPTKDTIPRSAVEYYLRKETVNTNPDAYESHERFIAYMDDPDISQFGHWMHSNGFNCALTAISVDLEKIPSVTPSAQPGWIPVAERLPERDKDVLVTRDYDGRADHIKSCRYVEVASCYGEDDDVSWISYSDEYKITPKNHRVLAWMPLPIPYREGEPNE